MASRVRDKWRLKKIYKVLSSSAFGQIEIGMTLASDESKLIGRVIETSLSDLVGDFSFLHIKLRFQIMEVDGNICKTIFKGHELSRDYIRSLIRRGTTFIDSIFNITTKDGYTLRVTVVIITKHRAKSSQARTIRKISKEICVAKAAELNFDEFVQQMVLGKVASDIYNSAKKIYPLKKVEVSKSKLLLKPAVVESIITNIKSKT
ncbi:MAG: 30S ribosomal protein S3ae [Candidatus Methanomethylicia archaeon]|nr:30S ribosomal protein S3ae [Candidatus Methanomethylicia archaeon]MCX8169051.1 30S ribosomal protein S3ae [Candidatus Methanomethylicia archaeon]MDW7988783.1 30S ribosomal protein S3ae [Nitrososphaerota archaeon]